MGKLLVLLGPTATGKTGLGLKLAKKLNGELVACDSRQVYIGLDIGTGKIPGNIKNQKLNIKYGDGYWLIDGIHLWMYDVISPKLQYTVADYIQDASRAIKDIKKRGKLPIVVGGTGLYLRALLEGLPNLSIPVNKKLREELGKLTKYKLQKKLQKLSSKVWEEMNQSDRENPKRLLRSIELLLMYPYKRTYQISNIKYQKSEILKIGLVAPRQVLYENINSRVFDWINHGIIEEVKGLLGQGVSEERIKQLGLEYRVIIDYIDKSLSSELLIEKMQTKTRQYAKRQLTWFKREQDVSWFDISDRNYLGKIESLVGKWYHKANN